MSKLNIKVSISDIEVYKDIINILKDITEDNRIDSNIREEYKERLLNIFDDYYNRTVINS